LTFHPSLKGQIEISKQNFQTWVLNICEPDGIDRSMTKYSLTNFVNLSGFIHINNSYHMPVCQIEKSKQNSKSAFWTLLNPTELTDPWQNIHSQTLWTYRRSCWQPWRIDLPRNNLFKVIKWTFWQNWLTILIWMAI
jgi:hypothetical protein